MGKNTDFAGVIQKKSRVADLGWLFRLLEKTKKRISISDDLPVTTVCMMRRIDGLRYPVFMGAMNAYSAIVSRVNDFFYGLKMLPIRIWQNIGETLTIQCGIRLVFMDEKPCTVMRARVRAIQSVAFSIVEDVFKMPISMRSRLSCYPSRMKMMKSTVSGGALRASVSTNAAKLHRESVSSGRMTGSSVGSRGKFHQHFE
ncbi:MAG: hypothetical protein WC477_07780 [Patescibacteria group bacterium]